MKRGILFILLFFLPSVALAQASVSAPLSDPGGGRIYRAIDRLVAAGVVDEIVVGQRPYTRFEVARILLEAEKNFGRLKNPTDKMMVWRILKYSSAEYSEEIRFMEGGSGRHGPWQWRPFERIDVYYHYLDAPARAIPANGWGSVDGRVRPVTDYMGGRHVSDGHNFGFETYHAAGGPFFAIYAHPRFQFQIVPGDSNGENEAFVQGLYGKLGWKNLEIEIGRDELVWGQGENGGLVFSTNPRPLDMAKISTPYPFRFPWIFEHLGNAKFSAMLANLGPDYNFRYSYLSGAKISLQPAAFFEAGFAYGWIFSGEGAPDSNFDKIFSPDFRFRIPPVSDAELYFEAYFRGPYSPAYLGGIYFPHLASANNMALRLEVRHGDKRSYRHGTWRSGLGINGYVMGDPLGPGGDGAYFSYNYDLGMSSALALSFAYERRGGFGPVESRYRPAVGLEFPFNERVRASGIFNYERAENFNFADADGRDSFFGGVVLSFDLDDIPHRERL